MTTHQEKECLVLENSSIPFVLIGPYRNHRAALVKSSNASLEMFGFFSINSPDAKSFLEDKRSPHPIPFTISILSYETKRIYNILKISKKDIKKNKFILTPENERMYEYWFVWEGNTTISGLLVLEKEFEKRIVDIINSINESPRITEWRLAPLITICSEMDRRRKKRVQLFQWLTYGFLLTYASFFGYMLFRFLKKSF